MRGEGGRIVMKERKDTMDGVGLLRGVRRASGTRVEKDQVRNGNTESGTSE